MDWWLLPGMIAPVDEAIDGPVSEGLRLEAQVVGQILRGKIDAALAVHNKNKSVQRL
jgi:hypothetical protein